MTDPSGPGYGKVEDGGLTYDVSTIMNWREYAGGSAVKMVRAGSGEEEAGWLLVPFGKSDMVMSWSGTLERCSFSEWPLLR